MTTLADSSTPVSTIGRFEILRKLGHGATAEVFLASDLLLNRLVAIKRLHRHLRSQRAIRKQFLREARTAASLNHPGIVHVYEAFEERDETSMVMEYVPGGTLRTKMGKISIGDFLSIARQCLEAAAFAHDLGIIHHDIKPENILVTARNRVKLCDFGLSSRTGHTSLSTMTAMSRTFCGTLAYAAPELLFGGEFDERIDIFSIGVVFYELWSGRNPFLADSLGSTLNRILHDHPAPLEDFNCDRSRMFTDTIHRMISKDAVERPGTTECLKVFRANSRVQMRAGRK
jgi:serine/threonine-protein kinase